MPRDHERATATRLQRFRVRGEADRAEEKTLSKRDGSVAILSGMLPADDNIPASRRRADLSIRSENNDVFACPYPHG